MKTLPISNASGCQLSGLPKCMYGGGEIHVRECWKSAIGAGSNPVNAVCESSFSKVKYLSYLVR